jgi:hypothetical protein
VQPGVNSAFDRRDVEAFLRHARHARDTDDLDPAVRESVAFRLALIADELDEVEPRWQLMRAWAQELRELLRRFAQPSTVMAMDGLRWP